MATLNEKQQEMCASSQWDFSDLKALFLNCTLKRSPEQSHTQGLIDIATAIMQKNGVSAETLAGSVHPGNFLSWDQVVASLILPADKGRHRPPL